MKKKSFTLLEVVIAIAIVALAAPLLFSLPFKLSQKHVNLLFETELQRVADVEWNKWQAKICAQELSWKDILETTNSSSFLEPQKCSISFGKGIKRDYLLKKEIIEIKKKQLSAEQEGILLKLKLYFVYKGESTAPPLIYQVYIQGPLLPACRNA